MGWRLTRISLLILLILIFPETFIFGSNTVSGWFTTGQDGDILLSGTDFNNAGYLNSEGDGLLFNHPGNIASDGTRLLLADTWNNRVLIWRTIPESNASPEMVLGQGSLTTNDPGTGLNRMNWPVGVSTANGKVVVADTQNDRILIWHSFPTANGQPSDLYLDLTQYDPEMGWPWAVWTNGTKLITTSTRGACVLIWNSFPTTDNQAADLILRGQNPDDGTNRFGTPRSIGSDGETYLVIGDHNPENESAEEGNFFWNSFPTFGNAPYDFFMTDPVESQVMWGGVKAPDGKFVTLGTRVHIWNAVPTAVTSPDLSVGKTYVVLSETVCDEDGYPFQDGDGSGVAITPSGKLFLSLPGRNMVVAYDSMPISANQCPDYAIGAPDIDTNTLETHYLISNLLPETDGKSLFAISEGWNRLYVWSSIPTESGIYPDVVYPSTLLSLGYAATDIALHEDTLVIAGEKAVDIWTTSPFYQRNPDTSFRNQIGPVTFQFIKGVALDDNYLYIADGDAGKLYVWSALPDSNSSPLFSLDLPGVYRLSSDGSYLAVVMMSDHKVRLYSVDGLSGSSSPVVEIPAEGFTYTPLNLPAGALVADNHLFIADTGGSRVLGWESIQDAINGSDPDVVLGQQNLLDTTSAIGVNRLFMPAGLAFHRNRLWVGEFKFSNRLVGFKYQPEGPFIESNPTSADFDMVGIGSDSTETFAISSAGTEALEIGTITLAGTDASEFSTQNDNCSGKTIAPSGTCTFDLIFSPTSEGVKKATLTIPSNDPAMPQLGVPLKGTGVEYHLYLPLILKNY